ncbi:MAG: zf-HC2 domain-containing protein [Armatimonadota bacterium]
MTCEQCRDNLTEFIEGELTPEREEQMCAHLAACSECARALAEIRVMVDALHDLPEVEPPADLRESLRGIASTAEAPSPAWWQRSRGVWTAVVGAAAAVLIIGAGVHFYPGAAGPMAPPMVADRPASVEDETIAAEREVNDAVEAAAEEPRSEAVPPSDDALAEAAAADSPAPSVEESAPSSGADAASAARPRRNAPSPRAAPVPEPEAASEPEPEPAPPVEDVAPSPGADGTIDADGGSRGPAGPAGPATRSMVAEVEEPTFSRETLTLPEPKYLDAAEGTASTTFGEGTPFTVGVSPPHEKVTGAIVPATIRLEAEADVARTRVTVSGSDDLDLVGLHKDGMLFEGPLKAGQQTVLSVRMLAKKPGPQTMTLRVRSTDPIVDTQLDVRMGNFSEPTPSAERPVQFNFVGTPIREAVSEVSRQSGMSVVVDPGVGDATVTARADDAIPAGGALRAIAEAAGLQVTEKGGTIVVERAEVDQ